jgi:lipopolysaccharide/colanic/teichoic acid biosynthesis glycosyltransferase
MALGLRDPRLLTFPGIDDAPSAPYQYAVVGIVLSIVAFLFFRLSDNMSRFFSIHDVIQVCAATLTVVAGSDAILFVFNRLVGVPRSTPLIYGLVLGGGLLAGRALARLSRGELPPAAEMSCQPHLRRIILVGIDRFAAMVIKLTECQQPRTTQIVAALDSRERLRGRTINGVKIAGGPDDIEAVIEEYFVHGIEVDEVWITSQAVTAEAKDMIDQLCQARGVRASNIAEALNLAAAEETVHTRAASHAVKSPHDRYFRFRRVLDFACALALAVALAPVVAVVIVIVYLDVGGPIFFWQCRIGRRGNEFFLHKFRTYRAPYDRNGNPVPSTARLSKTGRLIRALRFDEIPQLINILSGDMALIGPRPLLPDDQPEDPTQRLLVRPGVTGWAQVVGGTSVTAGEKDALDVWYIHHATPLIDLKIVWRTLMVVLRGESRNQGEIDAALRWRKSKQNTDKQFVGYRELAQAN